MKNYKLGMPVPKILLFIMRITFFLFVVGVMQIYAADSYAQRTHLTIRENKIELGELFKKIEQQTDFYFFYSNNQINKHTKVSVDVKDKTIFEILDIVLNNTDIAYQVNDKAIVLSTKGQSDFKIENQQQVKRRITGKVVDEGSDPIIGANIIEAGTTNGTVTDIDGNFVLDVTDGATIRVSYIGYLEQEIVTSGRTTFNVMLIEDMKALEEVVVIGYGTKNKNQIVGAVNQVTSETFSNKAVSNVGQALQGAIPNLNISFSDGQINRNASMNIRGMTSINGGSPLILIDGVPGSMNLIHPEDIASISVLKDASSAAIYGAQASYGVILITTKKGESEKPRFRYSVNAGFGQPLKTPKVLMDGIQYVDILQEAYNGWTGSDLEALTQVKNYLVAYDEDPTLPISYVNNMYFSFIDGRMTDWYDLIYNDSQPFTRHSLEVSGKSDRVNYFLSAGLLNQDGAYKVATDKLRKYSMRGKIDLELNDRIMIYNNFSIEDQNYDSPMTNVTGSNNILRFMTQLTSPFSSPYDNEGNYSYGGMVSLGLLKDGGRTIQRTNTVRNTFGTEINLLKDVWTLKGDYSIWWDRSRGDDQKFQLSYASTPGRVAPLSAMADYYASAYSQGIMQTANIYTDVTKQIGEHTIGGIVGFNQSVNEYNMFRGQINDNMFPTYGSLNLGDGVQTVGDDAYEWATRGYFYRLSYDYKQKYLAELNGRYDGTSRFPQDNRWGFFPSAAAGWVISEEPFMEFSKPALDILKVRASYGMLGNQQVSPFSYYSTMSKSQMSYIHEGERIYGMSTPRIVSGDLTWETVVTKNVGVDMGYFRNRLSLGLDLYERETLDMLSSGVSLPAVLGTSAPQTNSADLSVKGWEASLMWRDSFRLLGKEARYSLRVVMADNKAVITRYSGNDGRLLSGYNVGEDIGTIWGLTTLGFFESDEEAIGWADQTEVSMLPNDLGAGDIKFEDKNNDGRITKGKQTLYDHGDLTRIGNSSIRYPYSFDMSFDWNNFDLNIFFQGVGQRDFYPGPEASLFWGFYNRYYNPVMEHHVGNYWTPENPNAYFPRLRAYIAQKDIHELGVTQTRYLQDASYLRLKTLSLGYTIPKSITMKAGLERVRMFFSGQNLLTFTKLHEAFDPEAIANSSGNGAGLVYPIQRTITVGLDINF